MAFEKGHKLSVGNKGGRVLVYDEEYIDDIIKRLNAWLDKEDSLSILGFCADHYLSYQRVSEFCHKWPKFAEAFSIAKMKLGSKRERGGMLGKFDAGIIKQTQINYDPFLVESIKELKKSESGNVPITINKVLPYDDSDK